MAIRDTTIEELRAENEDLRLRLEEAEEALQAIRSGEVDALVVSAPDGARVYTLEGAEHPYRMLVESINEGAATLASDGTILYCNSSLATLLQVPLEKLIGSNFTSRAAAPDVTTVAAILERCRKEQCRAEVRLVTSGGHYVPVLFSCRGLGMEKDGLSAVITDLSEKKRADEIVASGELTGSIIEQAGQVILVCDANGKIIRASQLAHELYEKNLLGERFDEVCVLRMGDSRSIFSILDPLQGRTIRNEEVMLEGKTSPERHFVLNAGTLTDRQGKVIGCIVTLTDITYRKRAEQAVLKSEARFRSLFEGALDGIFLTSTGGRMLAANPAACEIFMMPEEELCELGRGGIVDEDDPAVIELLEERRRTGKTRGELTFKRKDGTRFPADVTSVIVGGEEPHAFVIFRDITDRKLAENSLLVAKDELEREVAMRTDELAQTLARLEEEMVARINAVEALREKERMLIHQGRQAALGEMIGNIAHQWRQPLNVLGLIIQKMPLAYRKGLFTEVFLDESVTNAMRMINHMSVTIDDFRNFFRLDRDKTAFKISQAVDNALRLIEGSFESRQIDIAIDYGEDPVICGYPNEYAQVVLNILNNAKDTFEARKIESPRIVIAAYATGEASVLTVRDNAGGIPDNIMPKIFDPYFTTKGPQGTGIGLFMAKNIMEKNMNGSISVRNTGDGAEFRIEAGTVHGC
ncbi:PAS domain S-box protein [Geobacter sp. DSM 9736]|uniref:PAS domain S-box protein n=1 Tax=Geobacter sp. DSM 9736 TaxID=1277350 RepID=UPI000B506459|nr:PAS domain S-box protein [Geobacter sp. DSM 9736]SNB47277.1 PAS domain S-box-containing protein [Geobacter sp. DSM 9736]